MSELELLPFILLVLKQQHPLLYLLLYFSFRLERYVALPPCRNFRKTRCTVLVNQTNALCSSQRQRPLANHSTRSKTRLCGSVEWLPHRWRRGHPIITDRYVGCHDSESTLPRHERHGAVKRLDVLAHGMKPRHSRPQHHVNQHRQEVIRGAGGITLGPPG